MKYLSILITIILSLLSCENSQEPEKTISELITDGWTSFEDRDYESALQYFKEAINLNNNNADSHSGAGWSAGKLAQYLKQTRKRSGALFTSDSNNSKNKRLTTRSIRRIVKSFLILNNINKVVHGFRHYFTTKLIERMDDLLIVQEFTRHKSLEMLQIYNDRLRKIDELPAYYNTFETVNFS